MFSPGFWRIGFPAVATADQRCVAFHEAGHATVGLLSGMGAPKVQRLTHDGGEVQWPSVALHTRASALAELRMLLAGRAAEEVLLARKMKGSALETWVTKLRDLDRSTLTTATAQESVIPLDPG